MRQDEQTRLFDSFRSRYRAMYPFTVFHASAQTNRRYTLYAVSEADREQWRKMLEDAVTVRKVRLESNMVGLFAFVLLPAAITFGITDTRWCVIVVRPAYDQ